MSSNDSDNGNGRRSSLEEQVDTTSTSRERLGSGGSGNFDSEWDAAAKEGKSGEHGYFYNKLTFTSHYIYIL